MIELPLGLATLLPSVIKQFRPCCAGDGMRLFPRASVLENASVRIKLPWVTDGHRFCYVIAEDFRQVGDIAAEWKLIATDQV